MGADEQNFRIIDVARAIVAEMPGSELVIRDGATADRRSYRVRFSRIRAMLPDFECSHGLQFGIRELKAAYERAPLHAPERFVRLSTCRGLLAADAIDGAAAVPLGGRRLT